METIATFWRDVFLSQPFLLALSVVTYFGAQYIYNRFKILLLHPILVASMAVIAVLKLTGVEYQHYYEANSILNLLLNISVVSLSYLMHKNINRIKEHKLSIVISTFVGSIVGVVSVIGLCYLFGCEEVVTLSIEPKSVTTAIAVSLSESCGGIPALTSLAVIVAGISGSIFGPKLLEMCGIRDAVARGVALGSASHAVGTARALELGAVEGAVGGAAICLMGIFTSLTLPLINLIWG